MHRPLVVLLAVLSLAPTASGALDARLSIVPATPISGERVAISVRPYWPYARPDGTCCTFVPADVAYPFRVQLLSRGRAIEIRASRTPDPYVWKARFRFPTAGTWRVRLTTYYNDQACKRLRCAYKGPELVVRVR